MEIRSSFKTLNSITLTPPIPFRSRACLFRSLNLAQLKTKFHSSLSSSSSSSSSFQRFSPLCSLHEGGNTSSLPHGVGEAVCQVSRNKLLQVVLVSPQIPGNTGCIARTCAASSVGLHLVGEGEKRLLAFTKRGAAIHSDFSYRKGDYLIFGSETSGLPREALLDCKSEAFGGGTIRIPMVETYVRCLNLSVSVGIALYEAARQLNYEQLQSPSQTCTNGEQSFLTEDIFA